ncbi:MAG TPA: hypothetical protein VG267_03355 [Terracidiphilus sp.]|jgi:hypothetical protein|nr:hypothetical protein [Terracidiphilus sp.]
MRLTRATIWIAGAILASTWACAQDQGELRLHLVSSLAGKPRAVPAVLWLEPQPGTAAVPLLPSGHYRLLQKNRTFIPHLQVIPVGAVVEFPNADPFFHNVFSLYEGKRFDLGLYEAGSSKSTTFAREGVSYIFCNIHPEMSAVVLSLSTRLYAIADEHNGFDLRGIPPGDYKLHLWIESVPQAFLRGLVRNVHVPARTTDLGGISAPIPRAGTAMHANMFGDAYDKEAPGTY